MAAHEVLAPSGAGIWGHCSYYPWAALQWPGWATQASREGTAAHSVGEQTIRHLMGGGIACANDLLGAEMANGVVVTEDIADGAQVYVDEATRLANKFGWENCVVEQRVDMPYIHPQNGGTLDLAFLNRGDDGVVKTLILRDYKHGRRAVDPRGNLQAADYLLGLVEGLGVPCAEDSVTYFDAGIIQPRCYHPDGAVRTWTGPIYELRGYWNLLHGQAHAAFNDPKTCAGPWCRDCPAMHHNACAAVSTLAYGVMDSIETPPVMADMPDQSLALYWDQLQQAHTLIKSMADAAEEDLRHRISRGATGTGKALRAKRGNLAWDEDPETVIATFAMVGIDVAKPTAQTPTQVKNAAKGDAKKAVEQMVNGLASRPNRGSTLINAEDHVALRAFKSLIVGE